MAKRIPFSVVFTSGEESDFPSSELNFHGPTVHGWHSNPDTSASIQQEIVLRFLHPANICRIQVLTHQYLIPSRIELWVHYSPKNLATTPSSQTYEYLGFISLSDNSATKFKSRELQSVAVGPRNGTHLKLRLGEAHVNQLNPHKQVALIAVNVIGFEIMVDEKPNSSSQHNFLNFHNNHYPTSADTTTDTEQQIQLTSICDDLSFSMYVEESITETVREIEQKKSQAVIDERFEYARKLKLCMTALRSAGERLGRYALAKRQAVQQEDFITAKLRKEQMEIYRKSVFNQLEVNKLLERNEFDPENDLVSEIYTQKPVLPSPPSLQDVASNLCEPSFVVPKGIKDGVTISSPSSFATESTTTMSNTINSGIDALSTTLVNVKPPNSPLLNSLGRSPKRGSPTTGSFRRRNKSAPRNSYEDYEERAVPALRHSHTNEFLRECQGAAMLEMDPCRGRSRLNERERRQAALPLLVFGNDMVELIYSRQFQDRESGLELLKDILTSNEPLQNPNSSVNKIVRSSALLLHRSVRDAVFSVFSLATETVRALFVHFIPSKVSHSEVARCVDRLLPELLAKCGDPSPRIHTLAQHTILTIATCEEVKVQHLIAPALSRNVGSGTHPRLALSRMQMLEQLVLSQGISTDKQSGLTCRSLSECGCSGIHHPSEPVRKVAERVLLLVYKINPRLVRKQLPPDDDVTRRNLLYRQLFTEFDKLDLSRRKELLETNKLGNMTDEIKLPMTTMSLSTQPPASSSNSHHHHHQHHLKSATTEQKQKTVKYESRGRFGFNGSGGSGGGGYNMPINKKKSTSLNSHDHRSAGVTLSVSPGNGMFKSKIGPSMRVTNNMSDDQTSSVEESLAVGVTSLSLSSKTVDGHHNIERKISSNNPNADENPEFNKKLKRSFFNDNNLSRKSSNSDTGGEEHNENSLDKNCPFCDWNYIGESSELDKHFWKACPILTKCPQCSQVLEVSVLSWHLANECEAKCSYIICDICTEAVHKDLLEIHLKKEYCKPIASGTVRCPLCNTDVMKPLDGGWKIHLLSTGGCPGNARRRSKV